MHFYFYLSYYSNAQVQEWKHFVFFFLSGCQMSIMVTGIPVTCLRSSRSIQVLCECLNPCTAQNTCKIYKISKHTSLEIYSLTLFKNIFQPNLDWLRITKTKETSAELWYNNILLKRKHHLHDCNSDNYSTSGCIWIRSPSFSKSSNNINKSPVVLHSSLGTASLLLFLFLLVNLCKR